MGGILDWILDIFCHCFLWRVVGYEFDKALEKIYLMISNEKGSMLDRAFLLSVKPSENFLPQIEDINRNQPAQRDVIEEKNQNSQDQHDQQGVFSEFVGFLQ